MPKIENKVSESSLIQINLEDYMPQLEWAEVDIAQFLENGLILREKEFRNSLKSLNLEHYKDKGIYMICSTDAIFPEWVYLLLTSYLIKVTPYIFIGNKESTQNQLLNQTLLNFDYSIYKDKSLIIKGCGNSMITASQLNLFFEKAVPFAKSIMYGEACSSVPIYKKSK